MSGKSKGLKSSSIKGVTAKMRLSLSISGHTLVMESPKVGQRIKLFQSFSALNALTLGPSLRDSITKVWSEIERLSHIFAVTPFITVLLPVFLRHLVYPLPPTTPPITRAVHTAPFLLALCHLLLLPDSDM